MASPRRPATTGHQLMETKCASYNRPLQAPADFPQFCKKRFYDDSDLFQHMERQHEHCHICRRHAPDKFVYFRDYDDLHKHFARVSAVALLKWLPVIARRQTQDRLSHIWATMCCFPGPGALLVEGRSVRSHWL